MVSGRHTDLMRQANAMRTHLTTLNKLYGAQSLVNLVNQKGYEKPVKDAYERFVDQVCALPFANRFVQYLI